MASSDICSTAGMPIGFPVHAPSKILSSTVPPSKNGWTEDVPQNPSDGAMYGAPKTCACQ